MALATESIKDYSTLLLFCDIDEHEVIGPQQEVAVSIRIENLQEEVSIIISVRNTQLLSLALSTYTILSACLRSAASYTSAVLDECLTNFFAVISSE